MLTMSQPCACFGHCLNVILCITSYVTSVLSRASLHPWHASACNSLWNFFLFFGPIRYLHEVCLPSVVHRNFKSANILLDEELNPHLSDCGLAALTPNTERQVN